jgi:hypothetical protein
MIGQLDATLLALFEQTEIDTLRNRRKDAEARACAIVVRAKGWGLPGRIIGGHRISERDVSGGLARSERIFDRHRRYVRQQSASLR